MSNESCVHPDARGETEAAVLQSIVTELDAG